MCWIHAFNTPSSDKTCSRNSQQNKGIKKLRERKKRNMNHFLFLNHAALVVPFRNDDEMNFLYLFLYFLCCFSQAFQRGLYPGIGAPNIILKDRFGQYIIQFSGVCTMVPVNRSDAFRGHKKYISEGFFSPFSVGSTLVSKSSQLHCKFYRTSAGTEALNIPLYYEYNSA